VVETSDEPARSGEQGGCLFGIAAQAEELGQPASPGNLSRSLEERHGPPLDNLQPRDVPCPGLSMLCLSPRRLDVGEPEEGYQVVSFLSAVGLPDQILSEQCLFADRFDQTFSPGPTGGKKQTTATRESQ
jgi:hypothetical protein